MLRALFKQGSFWTIKNEKTFRDLGSWMNTALTIIGLAMFIFIIVFSLKRAKEKRKAQQEEHEKIKEHGESINEERRNKKWKNCHQKRKYDKS